MKRLLSLVLLILFALWASSVPVVAWEDGDVVAILRSSPKAAERETPYIRQSKMGCVAADAVREYVGTQLALVPTADIEGNLPQGIVTGANVKAVFSEDWEIAAAEITPHTLFQMLETAVSQMRLDTTTEMVAEGSEIFGGFCQISGFTFRYDVSAPIGERVLKVTLDDGTELSRSDDAGIITLAAPEYLLEGAYGFPVVRYQLAGGMLSEALGDYVSTRSVLPEGKTDRIELIGARNRTFVSGFPKGILVGGIMVLIVILAFYRMRFRRIQDEYGIN